MHNCRLHLRPDLHLLISRLTVLKQYIVLYPGKGIIAETIAIFFKVKLSEFTLAGPPR